MTPYSRVEYELAYTQKPKDKYDKALKFLIRLNMGHGFRITDEIVGWKNDISSRERGYAARHWSILPENMFMAHVRLKGVQIENQEAIKLIARFNKTNVLIYLDPPYVLDVRQGDMYKHEMCEKDHIDMLEAVRKHKGYVVISGYESKLYNDILRGWHKEYKNSYTQTGKRSREILWMNFVPDGQLKLF